MQIIKICLVDDSIDELQRLRECLNKDKKHKYEIAEASTGKDAVKLISSKPDLDLVILDYMLPDMNGIEILTELDRMNIHPRTIMLTSEVQSDHANKMNIKTIVAWLVKPFHEDRFLDLIPRALKKVMER